MLQTFVHYGCHILVPLLVAKTAFTENWKITFLIMVSGIWIDIDHVWATPIFDANRCSINFHPLHSYYAIICYVILLLPRKTRLVALGLLIHIMADAIDCAFM